MWLDVGLQAEESLLKHPVFALPPVNPHKEIKQSKA